MTRSQALNDIQARGEEGYIGRRAAFEPRFLFKLSAVGRQTDSHRLHPEGNGESGENGQTTEERSGWKIDDLRLSNRRSINGMTIVRFSRPQIPKEMSVSPFLSVCSCAVTLHE
jgi:hypothetical protein